MQSCGHRPRVSRILRMTFHEMLQLYFTSREESPAILHIKIRRGRKGCRRVSPQLDHMLNQQRSPVPLSQRRRIAVGPDRELGEIDRAEDTFNLV